MRYYNQDDKTSKVIGVVSVFVYCAMFVALFVWVGFDIAVEKEQGGIVIDFGDSDTGLGVEDTMLADDSTLPEAQEVPVVEDAMLTQQHEDALDIEQSSIVADDKLEQTKDIETEKDPIDEVKPREVDPRSRFPGNRHDSKSPSQGEDKEAGNQGRIEGAESDNYEGESGDSEFQPDWSLEGRRPRMEFPKPTYATNEAGIVIIEIQVDNLGNITSAVYHAKGSTLPPTSALVQEALEAARKAKFDESEQDLQIGTITYAFRLNK